VTPGTVLLGSRSVFTHAVLAHLVDSGVPPVALLVYDALPGDRVPRRLDAKPDLMRPGRDPFERARDAAVPVHAVGELEHRDTFALIDRLCPALIVSACFPRLVPESWRKRPAVTALNIHPSLLPAYRGPAPLFWQFRAGESLTGVTVHHLDAGMDTGPVLARERVSLPDGIRSDDADQLLASRGAELLATAIQSGEFPDQPQPVAGASRQGWPSEAARAIPLSWSARRAFNFIRGAERWGPLTLDGLPVLEAIGYGAETSPTTRPGVRHVRMARGVLAVLVGQRIDRSRHHDRSS